MSKLKIFPLVSIILLATFLFAGTAYASGGDDPQPQPEVPDEAWDWELDAGSGDSNAFFTDDGPYCTGSTFGFRHDHIDVIYGFSTMYCGPPATLQGMSAKLVRCNAWAGFFCLYFSDYEHLDSGSYNGSGGWYLPTDDVYYVSNTLPDGVYRVITRHTVTWPGGSHSGSSGSGWIHID